jgi:hypothetical protein
VGLLGNSSMREARHGDAVVDLSQRFENAHP